MSASAAATVASAAQKATSFANQTVETARFDVLKEPLGFIKIIQFFMALLAFAIAINGSSALSFSQSCARSISESSTPVSSGGYVTWIAQFSYPYDLTNSKLRLSGQCSNGFSSEPLDRAVITTDSTNIVSSAQFFVFTGVTSFIYSLVFFVIYVFFRHKYNNIVYFPLIDFGFTVLYALFWFIGSIAWAKAITDIQNYTDPSQIIQTFPKGCPTTGGNNSCYAGTSPTYANIIVSCILGFGNWLLWTGDCWFVIKETSWYKTRKQLQQQQQNVTNNPIANNMPISPGDINITAHYNPNNKI